MSCWNMLNQPISCSSSFCAYGPCEDTWEDAASDHFSNLIEDFVDQQQGDFYYSEAPTTDEFMEQTLQEAVTPFLEGTDWEPQDWINEYGMYFQPYDPKDEIFARDISSLREQGVMQKAEKDMRSVETAVGTSGLASSYQFGMGSEAVTNVAKTDLSKIRGVKGEKIYEARKAHMEDFYDTIKDLARLDAFADPPEPEEEPNLLDCMYDAEGNVIPGSCDTGPGSGIINQANCEALGGTFNYATGQCIGGIGTGGADSPCCEDLPFVTDDCQMCYDDDFDINPCLNPPC